MVWLAGGSSGCRASGTGEGKERLTRARHDLHLLAVQDSERHFGRFIMLPEPGKPKKHKKVRKGNREEFRNFRWHGSSWRCACLFMHTLDKSPGNHLQACVRRRPGIEIVRLGSRTGTRETPDTGDSCALVQVTQLECYTMRIGVASNAMVWLFRWLAEMVFQSCPCSESL
jgi:hypothetical protein